MLIRIVMEQALYDKWPENLLSITWKPFLMHNTLPTFFATLPITRTILIKEKILLVQRYQAFSNLCHETMG